MVYASRFLRVASPIMRGPDVRAVQQQLLEQGFYQGVVDGLYTPPLEMAVREFQRSRGLEIDGVVGPNTYQALFPGPKGEWNPLRLTVDVDSRVLQVREDNRVLNTYPVAVGKPATPTPLGDWVITEKLVDPGGDFGVRWMRISVPWGGYGIHGTNNPNSIGRAASHGCVRMYNEDVVTVYDMVNIGTPVKIIGTAYTGRILKLGSEGNDVRDVQEKLQILGYYTGDVDGVYGPLTQQAVAAFQKDQGLDPDGVVGALTYITLQKTWDIMLGDQQP